MCEAILFECVGLNAGDVASRNVCGALVEWMKSILDKEQDHGYEENAGEKAETGCADQEDANEETTGIAGEEGQKTIGANSEINKTIGSEIVNHR